MIKYSYGNTLGLREHLLSGQPITRLEAIAIFGVSNLTTSISEMRKKGFSVKKRDISMAEAIRSLNKTLPFSSPENLPITEIRMTQYWIEI